MTTVEATIQGSGDELFAGVKRVARMLDISVRQVHRLKADPRSGFPKPRKIGRRVLWLVSEIIAWAEGLASTR